MTLVALGDSITRGRGMVPAYGCDPRSWAAWLAEAMELPFLNLAEDGAGAAAVRERQLPRVPECALATLYVGVNDARSVGFDAGRFEDDVQHLVGTLAEHAGRVLVFTIPLDLGRPPAGAIEPANRLLRAAAEGHTIASLDDFGGWRHVLPDAVHPTALGQVDLARRAARALGVPEPDAGVRLGLRGDVRFAPFYARQLVKDHWRRFSEARAARMQ